MYDRVTALLAIPVDKSIRSDLATISDYYFDNNYPGDSNNPVSRQGAEDSIKVVIDIISFVGPGFTALDIIESKKMEKTP